METSSIVTPSVARVPKHTATEVNKRIREQAMQRVAYYREHPAEIGQRLKALNEEWDIERAFATARRASRCWAWRSGSARSALGSRSRLGVQGFYLQHAIQGWCPPLPVLRRLGFRTPMEIEQERVCSEGTSAKV